MSQVTRWMGEELQALRRYLQDGIVDAPTHFATVSLTLREAGRALRRLRAGLR